MLYSDLSTHGQRVRAFMAMAGQEVPKTPTVPPREIRLLRAKLILEEATETISALGFDVGFGEWECREKGGFLTDGGEWLDRDSHKPLERDKHAGFEWSGFAGVDLIEVADGCCDLNVVSTGTLLACGMSDRWLQKEVDDNNLKKFGKGSYKREDGKWIKPSDWEPPKLKALIESMK